MDDALRPPDCWPLSDQHCDTLDRVMHDLSVVQEVIRKCENAGLNMGEHPERCKQALLLAGKLKAEFFPQRQ